jgi:hypothetical protein
MILMKLGDEYKLYSHDSCIATTQESPHKRLSKQNCDEIFGVVDVEKLAEDFVCDIFGEDKKEIDLSNALVICFIKGFKKAMGLNKDKLFTEDDLRLAMHFGKFGEVNGQTTTIGFIQSLQQPTEIEVEMIYDRDCYSSAGPCDELTMSQCIMCTPVYPLKDENGCLILKRK